MYVMELLQINFYIFEKKKKNVGNLNYYLH